MRLNIYNSLMGLCVATAAVSCSNELVDENQLPVGSESDMISFVVADDNTRGGSLGDRSGSSTRSSVTTSVNIKDKSFAVYGDMTNLDSSNSIALFYNEPVSYKNGDWTYSNTRYWFPDREYSFLAIHPSSVIPNETGSTNGELTNFEYKGDASVSFDYTSPSDYSMATDILIAGHRRKHTSTTEVKTVELSFGHIMSRLNFVATLENKGIEIKQITINGIASKASYSVKPENIKSVTETSDLTGLSSEAGSFWTTPTNPITVSKTMTETNILSSVDQTGKISVSLFPENYPLLVIPQDVTGEMIVEVSYNYNGKNMPPIVGSLNTTSVNKWSPSLSYSYSFIIEVDKENIQFEQPTVSDWIDYEGGKYIIQ